jgi:D-methionine transport system substrate-binding protein
VLSVKRVTSWGLALCFLLLSVGPPAEAAVFRVGASPVPHGEFLRFVAAELQAKGIDLEIVPYENYEEPNFDLLDGKLDANYYQNRLFLEGFNRDYGTDLVAVGAVHFERMGIYSRKIRTLSEIPAEALVVHPADNVNRGRAFHLLAQAGLIGLSVNVSPEAGPFDVVDNPRRLRFQGVSAESVIGQIDRADVVVANANFALEAGLDPSRESLFEEQVQPLYHNVLVVRRDDLGRREVLELLSALRSGALRCHMAEVYGGAVIPVP